jgi:hypothetical protein
LFISAIKLILSIVVQEISIAQRFLKFRVFVSNMKNMLNLKMAYIGLGKEFLIWEKSILKLESYILIQSKSFWQTQKT